MFYFWDFNVRERNNTNNNKQVHFFCLMFARVSEKEIVVERASKITTKLN